MAFSSSFVLLAVLSALPFLLLLLLLLLQTQFLTACVVQQLLVDPSAVQCLSLSTF